MGGRSTQAGKAGVSPSASLSGGVTHAGFHLLRSRREHRPISSGSCSSRAQFLVCASLLRPKEGLLALWLLASGSHETQNSHLLLNHLWWLVMRLHTMGSVLLQHREFVQANILDGGPDNREKTGLGREEVDLIGALAHKAPQTFNGIGRLNVPVHRLRKLVKGQRLVFLLSQASHRFWIAFAIFGFEGLQLDHSLLFARLLPNSHEFGLNLSALSSGDRIEDVALLI